MADTNLGADPAPNNPRPAEPSPDECPDVYASICRGDCLEPEIRDGACLVFSKTEEPRSGDYVGFWLHPDAIDPGELPRRVKRLVMGGWPGLTFPFTLAQGSEVEPLIVLEQFNPPELYHVRASHILALHKVIGEAEIAPDGMARVTRQVIGGRMMRYEPEG